MNIMDSILNAYFEKFGCRIVIVFQTGELVLAKSKHKLYGLGEITDDELEALMRKSIEANKNLLLEKFKDNEYFFEDNPECDY